jgi:hypothetical protein
VLLDIFAVEPETVAGRPGQVLLADKNYYGHEFERVLGEMDLRLLRPALTTAIWQPQDRTADPAITGRLRPLIAWNQSSTRGRGAGRARGGAPATRP